MSEKVATKAAKKETKVRKLDEESEDSAPEVKKGRGRPKKDPSETKEGKKAAADSGEKKGRGRPKGSVKAEPKPRAEGAKRRGRPAKKTPSKKQSDEEDEGSDEA